MTPVAHDTQGHCRQYKLPVLHVCHFRGVCVEPAVVSPVHLGIFKTLVISESLPIRLEPDYDVSFHFVYQTENNHFSSFDRIYICIYAMLSL